MTFGMSTYIYWRTFIDMWMYIITSECIKLAQGNIKIGMRKKWQSMKNLKIYIYWRTSIDMGMYNVYNEKWMQQASLKGIFKKAWKKRGRRYEKEGKYF